MEIESSENSNWLFDYELVDTIPIVTGDFPASASGCFSWGPQSLNCSSNASVEVDFSFGTSDNVNEAGSKKRLRSESHSSSGSKACREKLRRDKLNERFLELSSILEPGRPPKTDKTVILSDAVRMVSQLRSEAQRFKELNEDLQAKIKELKTEKNELRDEKQRLKSDKEKMEQQVNYMRAPGFLPHPSAVPTAFATQGQGQGQAAGKNLMPFIGYPGLAMWQFMPPAAVDTSQDHVLRPPVA
ncbi:transcription factor ILR3-like isoform X2 [Tripterygium wilfordii]|uniref:Transcription factor ILR3-like isoform X2 n=1 Tax=Tripterygium wilfordii TaxID=458696 RepID=A0A7J7D535_TRIWF|nr:transcription factor ILR3-like [Tripterygium wilfordii]KAF5741450.1 transcription factor ILR3-like isoform X2 [Tripterygium wilfordii]